MSTLEDQIHHLDDATAVHILTTFASHQPGYQDHPPARELQQALHQNPDLSPTAADEGELARTALLLLAADPAHRPILTALVGGPAAQRYGMAKTAAVVGAVLFVLGTHISIDCDTQGQCSYKIEKEPTDPELLKALSEKLLGYLDKASSK